MKFNDQTLVPVNVINTTKTRRVHSETAHLQQCLTFLHGLKKMILHLDPVMTTGLI